MNLAKIQVLSLATKAVTTVLGIVQALLVVRILSPGEYGLIGLVMSIGGVIGVSQHLGIVDGAIREIAVRKDKREIGKVFWISHFTRQAVTIPLSLVLLFIAHPIAARLYGRPEIAVYIQVFAVILILQGLQDVLGATLTGMKRFGPLYIIQIITAAINIAVFGYLTWQFGMAGFFWAIIITTTIMIALLAAIVMRDLRGELNIPAWIDVKAYGKNLLRISVFMYIARICFVVWQRLPLLMLGGVLAAEELGYLNISLTFGQRLTIIAMALSEVNLSWMSSLFVNERNEFLRQVTKNMQRLVVLMSSIAMVLIFFTPEILTIFTPDYVPALPIVRFMTLAFFLYSLADVGTSSLFVSADNPKLRSASFGLMTGLTAVLLTIILINQPSSFLSAIVMLAGALAAYLFLIFMAQRLYKVRILSPQLAILILAFFGATAWLYTEPRMLARIIVFTLLMTYTIWEARRSKLLPDLRKLEIRKWKIGNSKLTNQSSYQLSTSWRTTSHKLNIICFAGAFYNQSTWTNRQHIMSRLAKEHMVLYVEPRVWIVRFIISHWYKPSVLLSYFKRLMWYEKKSNNLFIKSQWNLIPGSRENKAIATFNHWLNRWCVQATAWWLGFTVNQNQALVTWIYDTEAAEYLSAFKGAVVVYDCVDNHAAQAGVDRNPARVHEEEENIVRNADLVTVTSKRLYEKWKGRARNLHLVLNAGDVELYSSSPSTEALNLAKKRLENISHPILGMVGALDAYKVDFELLFKTATQHPNWQFVFIGEPVVERQTKSLRNIKKLPNVHVIGQVPRQHVPAFVAYFDVCLIPYCANEYNAASFPLKFWEFMATSKPIVVAGLPELEEYVPLITYVKNSQEFEEAITSSLMHREDEKRAERVVLAQKHTWDVRTNTLQALLLQILK